MKKSILIHGYVASVMFSSGPRSFTGSGYSEHMNDAKVFRTPTGAKQAARYWNTCDNNFKRLPNFEERLKVCPVALMPVSG